MRGAKAQAVTIGLMLSNTFEIGKDDALNFPPLDLQIRARRTRTEWSRGGLLN